MALRALLAINLLLVGLFTKWCDNRPTAEKLVLYNIDSIQVENKNGILYTDNFLFTGRLYAMSAHEDTIFSRGYVNGLEDGPHKLWYPNGKLQEVRYYTNGKKRGINVGFWPDGSKRYTYKFVDGLYDGIQYEWHSNHKLYSKKNYKAGYESGLQQSWNPDGSVKSNYEAKNGRNYGNIGKKNCYSVWRELPVATAH